MNNVCKNTINGFEKLYGYKPEGVWSAPGRVNLIGEHTDYNEGFVFPFAINKRTYVAVGNRNDKKIRVASTFSDDTIEIDIDNLSPQNVSGWSAYPLGVAWAIIDKGVESINLVGVDLYIDSDVPVGAGLSSSAAIESAVVVALNDIWNLNLDLQTMAKIGQLAENKAVGAPTGIMDQSASLLGKRDAGVFLDCRTLEAEIVPLGFEAASLELLVIDTKVKHSHVSGGYAERRDSCEHAANVMGVKSLRDLTVADLDEMEQKLEDVPFRRARHVITENNRVEKVIELMRSGATTKIGEFLDASHVSMRDDFEISVPELDLIVEIAQANGALGARMTGGGFGGAAIALVPTSKRDELEKLVLKAFEEKGYKTPDIFVVNATDGANSEKEVLL